MEKFLNKVICGDCLKVLKEIPDKSVDLVLTDPPYGISQKSGGFKGKELEFGEWDEFSDKQMEELLEEIVRMARGSVFMFCSAEQLSGIIKRFKEEGFLVRQLIWYKPTAFSMNADKMYMWATENVVWAKRSRALFNPRLKSNLFICNTEPNNTRQHRTQKPLELIKEFVIDSTKERDLVLDPFLGSGTTAVAAKQLNRNFIGIEINPDYCDIARERLRQDTLKI